MFDFDNIDAQDSSHESLYMNAITLDVYEHATEKDIIFDYDNGIVNFMNAEVFNDQIDVWYANNYAIPLHIKFETRGRYLFTKDLQWNFFKHILRRDCIHGPEFEFVLNTNRFCYYLQYIFNKLGENEDKIISAPFNYNYAYINCYRITYQDKCSAEDIAVRDRSNAAFKFYTMNKEDAKQILDIIEKQYPVYMLDPAFFSMLLGVLLYEKYYYRDYRINLNEEVKHCPSYSQYPTVDFLKEPIPVKIVLELVGHLKLM